MKPVSKNELLALVNRKKTNDDYDCSVLRDWLSVKLWRPDEAVCLICDIDPTGAYINWSFENYTGDIIGLPLLINAQLLREPSQFYSVPVKPNSPEAGYMKLPPMPGLPEHLTDEELALVEIKGQKLEFAQEKLRHVAMLFDRFPHPNDIDVLPPSYFIDWTLSEGIDIPWLSWANTNNLLGTATADAGNAMINQVQLDSRERNTFLVIIAALCNEIGINPEDRAVAKRVAGLTEDIGCKISYQTVLGKLKDLPDAVSLRQKSN